MVKSTRSLVTWYSIFKGSIMRRATASAIIASQSDEPCCHSVQEVKHGAVLAASIMSSTAGGYLQGVKTCRLSEGLCLAQICLHKRYDTACRITGKKTNPHLVRDSIVTYLRGSGASERELEALAIYMGHSLDMQRGTYDRCVKG